MSIASLSRWEVHYVRINRTFLPSKRFFGMFLFSLSAILLKLHLRPPPQFHQKDPVLDPGMAPASTNIHTSHNKKPHGAWLPSREIASTESPEIRSLPRSHWEWCPLVMTEEKKWNIDWFYWKYTTPSIPHPTWEKLLQQLQDLFLKLEQGTLRVIDEVVDLTTTCKNTFGIHVVPSLADAVFTARTFSKEALSKFWWTLNTQCESSDLHADFIT